MATPEPCSKHPLFLKEISSTFSAWMAIATALPILLLTCVIAYSNACGVRRLSQRRAQYHGSTALLVVIGLLAFFLNVSYMHMKGCDPPTPEWMPQAAVLAVFVGDIAAGVALVLWLIGTYTLFTASKKEQRRRASSTHGTRIGNVVARLSHIGTSLGR